MSNDVSVASSSKVQSNKNKGKVGEVFTSIKSIKSSNNEEKVGEVVTSMEVDK